MIFILSIPVFDLASYNTANCMIKVPSQKPCPIPDNEQREQNTCSEYMYGRYSLSGYVSHTSLDEKTQEYNCRVIHIKEHDTYKLIH